MRESLRVAETPKDVNTAKQLIQEHEEKWEDIQTHNDRYNSSLNCQPFPVPKINASTAPLSLSQNVLLSPWEIKWSKVDEVYQFLRIPNVSPSLC